MVDFAIVPTPKGEYRVAAARITWFRDENLNDPAAARSWVWLDDGSQATVLMSAADLQQLLHTVSEPAPTGPVLETRTTAP